MTQSHFKIGRYDIQQLLGRGAMGMVYLALDPRLKRLVAIKTLPGSNEDRQSLLKRFQREAEISAHINHPNVITIFDVGEDPRVGPYLAMEYIDGFLVSQLSREGLALEAAMRLLIQAGHGLQATANAGITHRDIKPDNMIVSRDGRVKLTDFGVAKGDETRFTQDGVLFGTPSYTAPELLEGMEASPVTDRYAFAVSAFELIFHQAPYKREVPAATLQAILKENPTFPEHTPLPLQKTFLKALSKKPEERQPSLDLFMADLIETLTLDPERKQRLQALWDGECNTLRNLTQTTPQTQTSGTLPLHFLQSTHPDDNKHPRSQQGPKARNPQWILGLPLLGLGLALALTLFVIARRTRAVEIVSSPPGAMVHLDGRLAGETPLKTSIPDGQSHLLKVDLEGYESLVRELRPEEWSLHLVLNRKPFYINIQSEPTDAEVFLNHRPVGLSPLWNLAIPGEGEHLLRLRKKGYESLNFSIRQGQQAPERFTLKKSKAQSPSSAKSR